MLEQKPRALFQAVPVRATVDQELLERGKLLPGGNYEMVKLLRLCADHGVDKVLEAKRKLPHGVTPSVDIIRSQLHVSPPSNILPFKQDINVIATDLSKYDKLCGVMTQ